MTAWQSLHRRALAGLAAFAVAVLLLFVEGVRATRFDLVAIAAICLLLGGLAWASRHRMTRGVP